MSVTHPLPSPRVAPAPALLVAGAALCLVLALPTLIAALQDDRLLRGVTVWAKPLKFQLSFGLHLLTLALLVRLVAPARRDGPVLATGAAAVVLAVWTEVLIVSLQAARGRESHFNVETVWEAVLYYGVMGGAALVIVALTFALGLEIRRHPRPGLAPGLRQGAVLGLTLGAVATLIVTAPLASGDVAGPGPWIGGTRGDAGGLWLTGWSRDGGDLRVPHFFATHLVQALPLAGWVADRAACRWPEARPARWVAALAVLGLAATAAAFAQALAGLPFIRG